MGKFKFGEARVVRSTSVKGGGNVQDRSLQRFGVVEQPMHLGDRPTKSLI